MENTILKLGGFSFAKVVNDLTYTAPEMGCDIWSIGMVLVEMIYGAAFLSGLVKQV